MEDRRKVGEPITVTVGGQPITVDPKALPDEVKARLIDYGIKVKLSRAAAGKKGPEAVEAVRRMAQSLTEGNWLLKGPSGTGAKSAAKKALLAAIAKIPIQFRPTVVDQLLKDGADITREEIKEAGLL